MNPHDKAKKKEQSQANRLVKMAESVEKFHDANGNAFATVQIKGHRQTFKMRFQILRRKRDASRIVGAQRIGQVLERSKRAVHARRCAIRTLQRRR